MTAAVLARSLRSGVAGGGGRGGWCSVVALRLDHFTNPHTHTQQNIRYIRGDRRTAELQKAISLVAVVACSQQAASASCGHDRHTNTKAHTHAHSHARPIV